MLLSTQTPTSTTHANVLAVVTLKRIGKQTVPNAKTNNVPSKKQALFTDSVKVKSNISPAIDNKSSKPTITSRASAFNEGRRVTANEITDTANIQQRTTTAWGQISGITARSVTENAA